MAPLRLQSRGWATLEGVRILQWLNVAAMAVGGLLAGMALLSLVFVAWEGRGLADDVFVARSLLGGSALLAGAVWLERSGIIPRA